MGSIKKDRWYIVDLRNKTQDKKSYWLLRVNFRTKEEARKVLNKNLGDKILFFDIVKGVTAIEFGFRYPKNTKGPSYLGYLRKYDYPPELETIQQRKSYRTKFRRWKRNYKEELKRSWV
ncbi:MAG: hypothetical protein CL596_05040 [Alteromonas sp.]|nr:hypothetical protein [Alteromonas sp.]|tara:strand:- start:5206 stop:5562 length:357 start_codon:yes stop_codon:yes gene_type:complete